MDFVENIKQEMLEGEAIVKQEKPGDFTLILPPQIEETNWLEEVKQEAEDDEDEDSNPQTSDIHSVALTHPAIMERYRDIEADHRNTLEMAAVIKKKYGVDVKLTLFSLKRGKGKFSINPKHIIKRWFYSCQFCAKKLLVTKDCDPHPRFFIGTHVKTCRNRQ